MSLEVGDRVICLREDCVYEGLRGTIIRDDLGGKEWCWIIRWDKNIVKHFKEHRLRGFEGLRVSDNDFDYRASRSDFEPVSALEQLAWVAE